jgi:hypothetical protein
MQIMPVPNPPPMPQGSPQPLLSPSIVLGGSLLLVVGVLLGCVIGAFFSRDRELESDLHKWVSWEIKRQEEIDSEKRARAAVEAEHIQEERRQAEDAAAKAQQRRVEEEAESRQKQAEEWQKQAPERARQQIAAKKLSELQRQLVSGRITSEAFFTKLQSEGLAADFNDPHKLFGEADGDYSQRWANNWWHYDLQRIMDEINHLKAQVSSGAMTKEKYEQAITDEKLGLFPESKLEK